MTIRRIRPYGESSEVTIPDQPLSTPEYKSSYVVLVTDNNNVHKRIAAGTISTFEHNPEEVFIVPIMGKLEIF